MIISEAKEEQSTPSVYVTESHQDDVCKSYLLILPYKGKSGEKTLRNITKEVNKIVPDKHKVTLVTLIQSLAPTLILRTLLRKNISMA